MADSEQKWHLRYETELNPFMDFIQATYCESDICVYRSVLSLPPSEIDSTPQSKRKMDSHPQELDLTLSPEDVESMTIDEKKDFVGNLGISVFVTKEKAEKNVWEIIKHIAKTFSIEEAKTYLEERRGAYVVRLQLAPEVGMLEKKFNKKGHANLLLYEDVDIKDLIVESYPRMKFEDIINNINNIGTNDGNKE